jgi:hypothetical protein
MKKLSVLLAAVLMALSTGCDRTREDVHEKSNDLKERGNQVLAQLKVKNNAVGIGAQEKLPSHPFTIHIERALMPSQNRPIAFLAELDDVRIEKGELIFSFQGGDLFWNVLHVDLSCDPENKAILIEKPVQLHAVVANIDQVTRVRFEVSPFGGYEVKDLGDDGRTIPGHVEGVELEVTTAPYYIATGRCRDIVQIEQPQELLKGLLSK